MVTLRTPVTGFPDLDAKIAFGLAWVVAQASEPEHDLELLPEGPTYVIRGEAGTDSVDRAFRTVSARVLAAESPFTIPGIQRKYMENYLSIDGKGKLKEIYERESLCRAYGDSAWSERSMFTGTMCSHELEPFGGSKGLILGLSVHAGKPYERNWAGQRDNMAICSLCGGLAVIGVAFGCFRGIAGNKRNVMVTPIPGRRMDRQCLEELFSTQREASGRSLGNNVPIDVVPLIYLATFPHLADLLGETESSLHIAGFASGRQDRLSGQRFEEALPYSRFISANSFNSAVVLRLKSGRVIHVRPLKDLSMALCAERKQERALRSSLFARGYAEATHSLLYEATTRFLMEVACVDEEILSSQAVSAVASVLRYFARQRNYWFVDAVRNAKSDAELEDVLCKALRQAHAVATSWQSRSSSGKSGNEHPPRIPLENQLQEVYRLINAGKRQDLQLYLATAALTWFGKKEVREDIEDAMPEPGYDNDSDEEEDE